MFFRRWLVAFSSLPAFWSLAPARVLVIAFAFAAPATAQANEEVRVTFSLAGGGTVVGQAASDDRVRREVVASLDLFPTVAIGRFRIEAYVEGNTTPRIDGVSRLVGEVNTDAGTALDVRRRGRVQLSEVRLVAPLGDAVEAHAGLLDATGFLDVSRIANDENLFFLGVPFVNNPTINFPDYALGGVVTGRFGNSQRWEFSAVVTSSNGLADNSNVSYAQLLRVTDEGKGVFTGATVRWEGDDRRFALGAWQNSADKERLSGSGTEGGAGLFGVAGWFTGSHSLSARVGIADEAVSLARAFGGITYLWAGSGNAFGVAVGRSLASPDVPAAVHVTHAEAFLRREVLAGIFATASLQRVLNPGFDGSGTTVSDSLWVPGIRLSAQF